MARMKPGWLLGDWLINYEGGFVRRGLAGEVFLLLGRLFHVSPIWFAIATYISLSILFLLSLRSLALASSMSPWVLALVVSPAAISYQVIHGTVAFRKEVLFLAGLSLFCVLIRKLTKSDATIAILLTAFLGACVLSHEALFFYCPYLFAALLLSGRGLGRCLRIFAVPFAAGGVALLLCSQHLGNAEVASQICSSLGYNISFVKESTGLCAGGAIPYLATSRAAAGAETLDMIVHYQFLWVFPCYALLALLPAIGESVRLLRADAQAEIRSRVWVVWIAAAVSFLFTLVLFRYAIDWGRWISIHISCITILLLLLSERKVAPVNTGRRVGVTPVRYRYAYGLLVLLYASCWTLPNDNEPLRMGYVGRALQAAQIIPRENSGSRPRTD